MPTPSWTITALNGSVLAVSRFVGVAAAPAGSRCLSVRRRAADETALARLPPQFFPRNKHGGGGGARFLSGVPNAEALLHVTNRASLAAPVRFNGTWKRYSGVGRPRHEATKVDLVVSLRHFPHHVKRAAADGRRKIAGKPILFHPLLTLEKRGRLPGSETQYLKPAQRELGELISSVSLALDHGCVERILSLDGVTREILQLSAAPEPQSFHAATDPTEIFGLRGELSSNPVRTTTADITTCVAGGADSTLKVKGQLGMQDGFMFLKLEEGDHCLLGALSPGRAFLLRHLLCFAIEQSRLFLPSTPFIRSRGTMEIQNARMVQPGESEADSGGESTGDSVSVGISQFSAAQ